MILSFSTVRWLFIMCCFSHAFICAGPLADYVQAPDTSFSWKVEQSFLLPQAQVYNLKVISQQWRTKEEINNTQWQHALTIIIPKELSSKTVVFSIGDGSLNCAAKENPCNLSLLDVALQTRSIVCDLSMVPNQPLKFSDEFDPRYKEIGRSEDALVAYSWDKFLKTGDSSWPLRLPMTKAVTRGMDAVEAFLKEQNIAVEDFILMGRSKRGWTAWTAAAVDKRVKAIIPVVIDLLNLKTSFTRHYMAYGNWSFAVKDYEDIDLPKRWNEKPFYDLMKIVEPYEYRSLFTMSKFIINASGDEFFLPDSSRYYFKDLPGEKLLAYVPNTGHFISKEDYQERVIAYINLLASNKPMPSYDVTLDSEGTLKLITNGEHKPVKVDLWQAYNPQGRDFRVVTIGKSWQAKALAPNSAGEYVATLAKPQKGWSAYLLELSYKTDSGHILKVTSDVFIFPETFPFKAPNE